MQSKLKMVSQMKWDWRLRDWSVTIYNISWSLNHKLKLLVELVLWHGIRSHRDIRSRVQISTTPHLKRIFSSRYKKDLYCIHTSIPKSSCERGSIRVYNISWSLNHKLMLLVELVLWHDLKFSAQTVHLQHNFKLHP